MADKNDIVILNLDRPRLVWFGHKALKTLCAMTNKRLNDINELFDNIEENLETIMYCGLLTDAKKNNEIIKLEDMEDLLDSAKYGDVIEAFNKAFGSAMGYEEVSENKDKSKTGKNQKGTAQ